VALPKSFPHPIDVILVIEKLHHSTLQNNNAHKGTRAFVIGNDIGGMRIDLLRNAKSASENRERVGG
jgi:hypothetical protein